MVENFTLNAFVEYSGVVQVMHMYWCIMHNFFLFVTSIRLLSEPEAN